MTEEQEIRKAAIELALKLGPVNEAFWYVVSMMENYLREGTKGGKS